MTVAEAVRELTEAIKEAQLELPGVSTDDVGKILMVDAEGKWVAILPTAELPDTTGASEGDVLKVGSSGLEWSEAGGGGLTLYGPYIATVPDDYTVNRGNMTPAMLSAIYNTDHVPVEAPLTQHIELYSGVYSPIPVVGFAAGRFITNDELYSPPEVTLYLPEGESVPGSVRVNGENLFALIYSDVEFTPIE